MQGGDDRVVVGGRQDRDDVAAGGGHGARHVDALAAGLGAARAEARDGAALERAGEGQGAVEARVGGQRDDASGRETFMRPPPRSRAPRARRRRRVGLVVGDEDVDVLDGRESDQVLPAELAAVGEHDDPLSGRRHRPLGGGLGLVGRAEPVPGADPVGAEESDVDAEVGQRPDRGVTDGGLGDAADPAAEHVQRDAGRGGRRAAIGTEFVATSSRRSGGRTSARAAVVLPPSRRTLPSCRGAARGPRRRSRAWPPCACRAARQRGLDQRERRPPARRRRAPAEHPGPLEDREVAPDGLGGDAELLGDRGDGQPAALGDQGGDRVLAFLGVHARLPGRRTRMFVRVAL